MIFAMKISLAVSLAASTTALPSYTPVRVTLDELRSPPPEVEFRIRSALASTGVLSVELPRNDDNNGGGGGGVGRTSEKDKWARLQASCSSRSAASKTHEYADGSSRSTMASSDGAPVPHGEEGSLSAECRAFDAASDKFRRLASEAASAFADRVGAMLGDVDDSKSTRSSKQPLLERPAYEGREAGSYDSFRDVVDGGERLEHFHTYAYPPTKRRNTSGGRDNDDGTFAEPTVDWHTDQGLYIVFSPGRRVGTGTGVGGEDNNEARLGSPGGLTDGFFIELPNGDQAQLNFDDGRDDLVIMLGEGIHRIAGDHEDVEHRRVFRATPHALSLTAPEDASATVRTWYGLMVLPPGDAAVPGAGGDMTYSELREGMIRESLSTQHDDEMDLQSYVSVGCGGGGGSDSSSHTGLSSPTPSRVARQLEEGCADGQSYCWHRCQTHAAFAISPDICANTVTSDGRPHEVACTNPRLQLAPPNKHGDFTLRCIDVQSADNHTAPPPLDNDPRDETCEGDVAFKSFFEVVGSGYEHSIDLLGRSMERHSKLHYTVTTNAAGSRVLKGRLSFDGLFGWLAFGLKAEDPDAHHGGMNGADIVLAMPGGDYDAVTGLDKSIDTTINEYHISEQKGGENDGSAFRHWTEPHSGTPDENNKYEIVETECHTALEFELSSIHGRSIDLLADGTVGHVDFIWGANEYDYYMGYHSKTRGHVSIDFATHDVKVNGIDPSKVVEDVEKKPQESLATTRFTSAALTVVVIAAGAALLGF